MSPDVGSAAEATLTERELNAPVSMTGATGRWARAIENASRQTGVPAALIQAVMRQESGGNPNARSPVGALGLMQLMPGTAAGLKVNAMNPEQNILGGARYLRSMYDKFGDWRLALAAYNAGPGALRASKDNPYYQVWEAPYNKGYAETRNYVRSITNAMRNGEK